MTCDSHWRPSNRFQMISLPHPLRSHSSSKVSIQKTYIKSVIWKESYSVLTVVFNLVIYSLLKLLLQVSACEKSMLDTLPCLFLISRVFIFSSRRELGSFEYFKGTTWKLGLSYLWSLLKRRCRCGRVIVLLKSWLDVLASCCLVQDWWTLRYI